MAEIVPILLALLSADNDLRKEAEAKNENALKNPLVYFKQLVQVLKLEGNNEDGAKQMAAVLLRRAVTQSDAFSALESSDKGEIAADVFSMLCDQKDMSKPVRRAATYLMGSMGGVMERERFGELYMAFLTQLEGGSPDVKLSMMMLFDQLVHKISETVAANPDHLQTVAKAYCFSLSEEQRFDVQVTGLHATISLSIGIEDGPNKQLASSQLPALICAMPERIHRNAAEHHSDCLKALEALASIGLNPQLLTESNNEEKFLEGLFNLAASQVDEEIRSAALDSIVDYADHNPTRIKARTEYVKKLFELCLRELTNLEEEEDWGMEEEDEDDEPVMMIEACHALDVLANTLRGKTVENVAGGMVLARLKNDDWKSKYAGLTALTQIAEGCRKQMVQNLNSLTPMILESLKHPNPQIRTAALRTVSQFCQDFSPKMQKRFYKDLIPSLTSMLSDSCPRVVDAAAEVIISVITPLKWGDVQPFTESLINALVAGMEQAGKHNKPFVMSGCLDTLGNLSGLAREDFGPYYDTVAGVLKQLIYTFCSGENAPTSGEVRKLFATAIDTFTNIGSYVGPDKFTKDAEQLGTFLMQPKYCQNNLTADDPLLDCLIMAWPKIAQFTGESFGQVLPDLIPPLLEKIQKAMELGDTGYLIGEGEMQKKEEEMRTAMEEEKELAFEALSAYLDAVPRLMWRYAAQILIASLPLVCYPLSSDLRAKAATCVPTSLQVMMMKWKTSPQEEWAPVMGLDPAQAPALPVKCISTLIDSVEDEEDPGTATIIRGAITHCTKLIEKNGIPVAEMTKIMRSLKRLFQDGIKSWQETRDIKQQEKDDGELEKITEYEENVEISSHQSLELISTLLQQHPGVASEVFRDNFLDFLGHLVKQGNTTEQRFGLYLLTDFAELAELEVVRPHVGILIKCMLQFAAHAVPDVARAGSYSLGSIAVRFPAAWEQDLQAACRVLLAVLEKFHKQTVNASIDDEDADTEAWAAVANAASSSLKFIDHPSVGMQSEGGQTLLRAVLQVVPVQGDEEEARFVHKKVVELWAAGDPVVAQAGPTLKASFSKHSGLLNKRSELFHDETLIQLRKALS